jgi:hypothetical protein
LYGVSGKPHVTRGGTSQRHKGGAIGDQNRHRADKLINLVLQSRGGCWCTPDRALVLMREKAIGAKCAAAMRMIPAGHQLAAEHTLFGDSAAAYRRAAALLLATPRLRHLPVITGRLSDAACSIGSSGADRQCHLGRGGKRAHLTQAIVLRPRSISAAMYVADVRRAEQNQPKLTEPVPPRLHE